MRRLLGAALALLCATVGPLDGRGQDQMPIGGDAKMAPNTIQSLTGKERLGRKWMDEQRIDNCKVPTDKHGAKLRSGACPHVPRG